MSKELQNLRQDKIIQLEKYEEAKRARDQVGMKRATNAISKINARIIEITQGF